MKDHSFSLVVTCGQHFESFCHCWLSIPEFLIQISNYPNSTRCLIGTDPLCQESIPGPLGVRQCLCLCATSMDEVDINKTIQGDQKCVRKFSGRIPDSKIKKGEWVGEVHTHMFGNADHFHGLHVLLTLVLWIFAFEGHLKHGLHDRFSWRRRVV